MPRLAFAITAMGPLDLLNHLLNFMAPAAAVAVLLALSVKVLMRKVAPASSLSTQIAINFVVGVLVLVAGMVVFGRDGKMASYATMVLACASSQWWAVRR
jgi:hypothetical protein